MDSKYQTTENGCRFDSVESKHLYFYMDRSFCHPRVLELVMARLWRLGCCNFFFLTRNQEMCCTCVHCIYLTGKPEQRPFNGILHAHLIKAKSCHLKTINHDRWDLMDLWVNVYYHCKFQVISRKCKLTSSWSSRTDAFQQGSNGFQFS